MKEQLREAIEKAIKASEWPQAQGAATLLRDLEIADVCAKYAVLAEVSIGVVRSQLPQTD